MRSLLFVPADSPRKLEKAIASGADAIILDLEDSVALPAKQEARAAAADFLARHRGARDIPKLLVRINALDSGFADADLDAVVVHRPEAIMLPKANGGDDVQHLAAKVAVREAEASIEDDITAILPIVTETAHAMFRLGSYRGSSRRLQALTWGAEDLAASIGALANRFADNSLTPPFALARNLTLFAAASAEVPAIDTIMADFRDSAALEKECEEARRDGFTGKMAIHPAQVEIINKAFTPTGEQIAHARKIIAAFAKDPNAGVVAIDGAMTDRPHLRQAESLLAQAKLADLV